MLAVGSVGNIYEHESDEAVRTQWYNDENQVIEAANAPELDRLLPSHWNMWRGVGTDPTVLFEHTASFRYPRTIKVVKIGDRLAVDRPGVLPSESLSASR